jgi:hypothetical protein
MKRGQPPDGVLFYGWIHRKYRAISGRIIVGDHTFFLDDSGLKILESARAHRSGSSGGEVLNSAVGAIQIKPR